eukprot:gb/GECG01002098.1/.p1 GENE.gb/GECG01002098.1/~~gb/GECG01002098.1/.p1  ORF type:complete len:416 (+),score=39.77 gb/GECG01002098.1/:1-1248(+)
MPPSNGRYFCNKFQQLYATLYTDECCAELVAFLRKTRSEEAVRRMVTEASSGTDHTGTADYLGQLLGAELVAVPAEQVTSLVEQMVNESKLAQTRVRTQFNAGKLQSTQMGTSVITYNAVKHQMRQTSNEARTGQRRQKRWAETTANPSEHVDALEERRNLRQLRTMANSGGHVEALRERRTMRQLQTIANPGEHVEHLGKRRKMRELQAKKNPKEHAAALRQRRNARNEHMDKLVQDHVNFLREEVPTQERQAEILNNIRSQLQPARTIQVPCSVCDCSYVDKEGRLMSLEEFMALPNLELLHSDRVDPPLSALLIQQYSIVQSVIDRGIPENIANKKLTGLLLSPRGIGESKVFTCTACLSSLQRGKLPKMAIANNNAIGELPNDLKDLSEMERRLCSPVVVRSVKHWILFEW